MNYKQRFLLATGLLLWSVSAYGADSETALARWIGQSSLYFIENHGQVAGPVRYYLPGRDKTVFVSDDALTVVLKSNATAAYALRLEFVGAKPDASLRGEGSKGPVVNLLTGGRESWRTDLPSYSRLVYTDLWPGIDLALVGDTQRVKYEFRVKPGADPSRIRLRYRGGESLRLEPSGDLAVDTPLGTLRDEQPFSFQELGGRRAEVSTQYLLTAAEDETFGFALADYDRTKPLVIDPAVFVSASYLGGAGEDVGSDVAVDRFGAVYVTGHTTSPETSFPAGAGFGSLPGADTSHNGGYDIFVVKALPSGTGLEYVTYIGGSGNDVDTRIAVDSSGNVYLAGYTNSGAQFPVVTGPTTSYHGGVNDVFVLKLNPSGTALVYSGFIGGNLDDRQPSIFLDASGSVYLTGLTYSNQASFPTGNGFGSLPGADQTHNGDSDAFIVKVSPDGSELQYASYIGGSGFDYGAGIGLDAAGNMYVGGETSSRENTFPDGDGVGAIPGPNTIYAGGPFDSFVVKLNAAGTSFSYVAFVGGAGEDRYTPAFTVNPQGSAWIAGRTLSSDDTFPTGNGFGSIQGFDRTYNGGLDVFVVKINSAGTAFDFATYIGGSADDDLQAIEIDSAGNTYATGRTDSTETTFPNGNGFGSITGPDTTYNGGPHDGFVAMLNAAGTDLVYATYIGGPGGGFYDELGTAITVDASRNAYVTGYTTSASGFPSGNGFGSLPGFDQSFNGGTDAFLVKISSGTGPGGLSIYPASASIIRGGQITLTASGCAPGFTSFSWTLLPSPAGGSLSGSSGPTVTYTAAQTTGDAVIRVSAACAAATTATVHVNQGPVPEGIVTLDPPITQGQGTVNVTATFSQPASMAMLCVDAQASCPAMQLVAPSGGRIWTYALPVAPTPGGLGFGPHGISVRGQSLAGEWGPVSKKQGLQVTRTKVVILLLNGYNFPSIGSHPDQWWQWSSSSIACELEHDFFGVSPESCASPSQPETQSNCTAESGPRHVCVVNTLDGRASVDVASVKVCGLVPGCPFSVFVPDNITLLNRFIDGIPWLKETEQLILVGHSYGGQIARAFATLYPGRVKAVFTIDTPHDGVEGWKTKTKDLFRNVLSVPNALLLNCPCANDYDDALPFFEPGSSSLTRFNSTYLLRRAPETLFFPIASEVKERLVGLLAPEDLKNPFSGTGGVQDLVVGYRVHANDDIVPVASQLGESALKSGGAQVVRPEKVYDVVRVPALSLGHLSHFSDVLHNAVIEDRTVWEGLYQQAIKPKLEALLPSAQALGERASHTPLPSGALTPAAGTAVRGPYRLIAHVNGHFTPTVISSSIAIPVDTSSELIVSVQASGTNPILVLNDPEGQAFTAATADGRTVLYASGSRDSRVIQTLVIRKPVAGVWTLDIRVPDSGNGPNLPAIGADWSAAAAVQSPIALALSMRDLSYLVGDTLSLTATVKDGDTGLAGLGVSAVLTPDGGGAPAAFTLYDDGQHGDGLAGDGVYGGSIVLGNWTGADIVVTAFGNSPRGPAQRQGSAHIVVDAVQATINGPFTEAAPDDDSNGRYDALIWSFPVQVTTAGGYSVVADLAAADGTVVSHASSSVIAAGAGDIQTELVFPGQDIYRSGRPGPYTLTNALVFFAATDGEHLVARGDQLATSEGPYWSWLSFEREESPSLFWLFPLVQQVTSNDSVNLQWQVQDGNGATTLDLFYDMTADGFDGTAIVTGIDAVNGLMSYTWDVSALPDGVYYVYARIRNGDFSNALYGGSIVRLIDADGDRMPDSWETLHGLNPNDPADDLQDPDGDGLASLDEYLNGTDPQRVDTDSGGESDYSELANRRDPANPADDVSELSLLSVAPAAGDSRGGDTLVMLGSGFQNGATVSFGGAAAPAVTFINSTRLMVTTPAHALGTVDVTVTNPGSSGSASKAGAFTFLCEFVEPPVAFSNAGSSPLCPGQDLRLGATGLSGATFSWTGPNGFTSSLQNPTISQAGAAASGVYTVTMHVGSCSLQATTTATVSGPPAPTATNSGPVCAGQDVQLNASSAVNGTFQWTGPGGFTSSSQAPVLPAAQPSASGTYSVTVSVNGCASPPATTSVLVHATCGSFYTVTPCRVLDTRGPAGSYGGPTLGGGTTRVFAFGGRCGIPATAKAVSLNVTVVDATTSGHLTLYPGDEPRPLVSAINFPAGQPRANNGIIRLGADGTLAVFSGQATGGTAQVIVDVNGYFE